MKGQVDDLKVYRFTYGQSNMCFDILILINSDMLGSFNMLTGQAADIGKLVKKCITVYNYHFHITVHLMFLSLGKKFTS